MKGKKMSRVLLFTFCLVVVFAITSALDDPVDEEDATEEEGVARPVRALSSSTSTSVSTSSSSSGGTTRKRGRSRRNHNRHRGSRNNNNGNGNEEEVNESTGGGGGRVRVQKRRLQQSAAFRPTRAPLFEASPPDPFIDQNGNVVEPTSQSYGHSHSPPTRDPYYSPSKSARERKRKRIKVHHHQQHNQDVSQEVVDHPSYEQGSSELKPEKNYAFAYAVGDEAEDHSHKQTKDGPITVGEYRITLPDGRTQVVRYTAGGKHGYKADVTYEAPNGVQQGQHQQHHELGGGGHLQPHQNQQYHASVQPTYHLNSATPVPTFNSNRIYKSRPLKNTALHNNQEVEYSPASSSDDEELEYHQHHHPSPHPTPKIHIKEGGRIPHPGPTTSDLLNGVSSTPTPRPNSIYDKISPYRNGGVNKYAGSDELAYAHEHSPRAGPSRGKSSSSKNKILKDVGPTLPTYYESPVSSPSPQPLPRKVSHSPTKKYKNAGVGYYVNGAAAHDHPRTHNHHQVNDQFIRPLNKHVQYLQETPIRHHSDSGVLVAKPVKEHQHILPINPYKSEVIPPQISYTPQPIVARKPKKLKKIKHGIHSPAGQYFYQSPVTAQVPIQTQPIQQTPLNQQHHHVTAYQTSGSPFHYYNSFHEPHHQHGYGQIAPSPTPITSVRHSESPLPNAYPVTAFPTGGSFLNEPSHIRLASPPSHHHQSGPHYIQDAPPSGDRPNRLGIKEALSRLPGNDLPTPKTTIHPYEVGAPDFGKSVAYGNGKGRDSGYHSSFPTGGGGLSSFDHLDPTINSLYNSVTSPSGGSGGTGFGTGGGTGQGYYPGDVSDQFNFLDGFHNFDIEQANVREIRQNRPTARGTKARAARNKNSSPQQFSSRRLQRRPDKRQGAPAQSSEEEVTPSPTPRQRQRQTTSKPTSRSQPTQPTTSRNRGRRRRVRTEQPDPMMHAVESRRNRPTSTTSRSNNNNNNN